MMPSLLASLEVTLGRVAFLQFIGSTRVPTQASRGWMTEVGWFAWEKVVLTLNGK